MKNFLYSLVLIATSLLISNQSFGQLEEKEVRMSLGNQNAIALPVDNVTEKSLESYFQSYFRTFGKVKYNRKAKEYFIDKANVDKISKDKVDLYARMLEVEGKVFLFLFVDNGLAFVTSENSENEFRGANVVLKEFELFVRQSLIEEQLKEAEKNLSSMEREIKQLEKDNEKYQKTIEDARKKIEEMEKAIEKNVEEQRTKTEEIEIHKAGVEEIKLRLKALKS